MAALSYQSQPTLIIRPWRGRILTTCAFTLVAAAILGLIGLVQVDSGLRDNRVFRLIVGVLFAVAAAALVVAALFPLHLLLASLRVTSDQVVESRIGRSRSYDLSDIADAVFDDPEHDLVLVMRNGYQAILGVLDHCHPDDRQRFLGQLATAIENREEQQA